MWKAVAGAVALIVAYIVYYVDDLIKSRKQLDGLVRLFIYLFSYQRPKFNLM